MTRTTAPNKLLSLGNLVHTRDLSTFIETSEIGGPTDEETPTPQVIGVRRALTMLPSTTTSMTTQAQAQD